MSNKSKINKSLSTSCENHGAWALFTCPGCYEDLPYDEWADSTGNCPICGKEICCEVIQVPVSFCRFTDYEGE
ncbi:MAG: hypothetical protein U9O94_06170 [Nanoarchaeota archaeon]|nr:hypothetical protein [Nanoarchaeota archaeon]